MVQLSLRVLWGKQCIMGVIPPRQVHLSEWNQSDRLSVISMASVSMALVFSRQTRPRRACKDLTALQNAGCHTWILCGVLSLPVSNHNRLFWLDCEGVTHNHPQPGPGRNQSRTADVSIMWMMDAGRFLGPSPPPVSFLYLKHDLNPFGIIISRCKY